MKHKPSEIHSHDAGTEVCHYQLENANDIHWKLFMVRKGLSSSDLYSFAPKKRSPITNTLVRTDQPGEAGKV